MKKVLYGFSALAVLATASCGKGNSSIVGTWTPSTERVIEQANHVTVLDSTYSLAGQVPVVTFTANGRYRTSYGGDSGTYTYASGVLTTISSTGSGNSSLKVSSLTDHSLSITGTDTTSTSPTLTTQQFTNTYTR